MSLFNFVVSFYAVLAGLGITLLLRSIGQILESRSRIQLYWVHSSWMLFIFLLHVNSWFTLWAYRDLASWTLGQLLLLVSSPIFLYLASHVAVPEIPQNDQSSYDMRAYFYERHHLLLGLLALAISVTLLAELFLLGQRVVSLNNGFRLFGLSALVIGAVTDNAKVHATLTLILLAVFAGSLTLLRNSIQ